MDYLIRLLNIQPHTITDNIDNPESLPINTGLIIEKEFGIELKYINSSALSIDEIEYIKALLKNYKIRTDNVVSDYDENTSLVNIVSENRCRLLSNLVSILSIYSVSIDEEQLVDGDNIINSSSESVINRYLNNDKKSIEYINIEDNKENKEDIPSAGGGSLEEIKQEYNAKEKEVSEEDVKPVLLVREEVSQKHRTNNVNKELILRNKIQDIKADISDIDENTYMLEYIFNRYALGDDAIEAYLGADRLFVYRSIYVENNMDYKQKIGALLQSAFLIPAEKLTSEEKIYISKEIEETHRKYRVARIFGEL